jgi:hypothetical protein
MKINSLIPSLPSLDPFLVGYLMAAYWTNDDDAPSGEYSSSGRPEEMHSKLSPKSLANAKKDCKNFQDENYELIKGNLKEAGHCLWLSRCGHGSGFFDSDKFGENERDILQEKARKLGNVDLCIGDDGIIYIE